MNATHSAFITFGYKAKPLFKLRYYFTRTTPILQPALAILTRDNLQDKHHIKSKSIALNNKPGSEAFINKVKAKKYTGCAKDFYLTINQPLLNRKQNSALHLGFFKYGLENFSFCVYEYFTCENKTGTSKLLSDLETIYISNFKAKALYLFRQLYEKGYQSRRI